MASGLTIDSGDYHASLDRALELVDYDELRASRQSGASAATRSSSASASRRTSRCAASRRRASSAALRYGAGGWDAATVRCLPTGTVQVADRHVAARPGSRDDDGADRRRRGSASASTTSRCCTATRRSSRSAWTRTAAAASPSAASRSTRPPARCSTRCATIAAHQLEVAEDDLESRTAAFSVKGSPDRGMTVPEAAFAAWTAHNLPDGMEPGLEATYVYDPPNFSWPSGAHIAVVEVDTETGAVDLVRYVAVDDVGNVINPAIVDGQVHGGIVQGVAQALWEEAVYDEDGNLLHELDAQLPRPERRRAAVVRARPDGDDEPDEPARRQGRGGDGHDRRAGRGDERRRRRARRTSASPSIEMPATPERVWRALQEAAA